MVGQILKTHKSENEVGPLTCTNKGERLDFSAENGLHATRLFKESKNNLTLDLQTK